NISWLPDGKALAAVFSNADTSFSQQQVGLISYPRGEFHPITADTNDYLSLSVSADGATIATVMRHLMRDVYVSAGEKSDFSDAKQITSGDPVPTVSWTKDGNLLTEQGESIREISPNGELKRDISSGKDSASGQPNGCSDGRVVFARGMLKSVS